MIYKKIIFIISFLLIHTAHADSKKIVFNYENEDLVNVINYVASQKNINVVLPMRPDQKINGKFTWQLDKKVTVDEAWDLLSTILDIAGYSIVPKAEYYEIVKTTKEVSREPVPLYVGTSLEALPPSDQRIRYIYYFANIKLQQGEGRQSEINTLLKALLPENSTYKVDAASNAILLLAPSTDVYSVMQVISQLDRPGFQEKLEILPLRYGNARIVADLFNKKILQTQAPTSRYNLGPKKPTEAQYFSKHLRLVANDRTNSLIMIGRTQAIERVKAFVGQYIDVKPESGKSIVHVYQLQYLDAPSFAEVLNNIVKSKKPEGTGQSTGAAAKTQGPERFFEDVVISVDTPKQEPFDQSIPGPGDGKDAKLPPAKYYGGNNLVIAARSDDWKRIKKLIEDLDQPKPQVLIEVLIADLTLNDNRALGNMFRNAAKLPMPGDMNFQTAQLDPGIVPDSFDKPNTIGIIPGGPVADVSRLFTIDSNGNRMDATPATEGPACITQDSGSSTGATSLEGQIGCDEPGSTVITLNDADGKTWSIARILKVLDHSKILSHPHVISTDNQEATIENTETRLLAGDTSTNTVNAVQKRENVNASLKVSIRPRISSALQNGKEVGTVNLQVIVDIDEFVSAASTTRFQRNVTTNAMVNSGDILAIGGLIRTSETNGNRETPLLSKIPLIGWMFKDKDKRNSRTNLTVFISLTIIQPRLRGGIGEYTQDYLKLQKSYAKGDLFDSLKDPITRWFFKADNATEKLTGEFMAHDEVHTKEYAPMPKEQTESTFRPKRGGKSATGLHVARNKSQAQKLKSLIQELDNPFEKHSAKNTQLAERNPKF